MSSARALHRPALLRLPAAPLRWLAGDMAEELLLTGRRVVPDKALRNGFVFRHAEPARRARRDPGRRDAESDDAGAACAAAPSGAGCQKVGRFALRDATAAGRVNLLRLDPSGPVISYAATNRSAGQRRRG